MENININEFIRSIAHTLTGLTMKRVLHYFFFSSVLLNVLNLMKPAETQK